MSSYNSILGSTFKPNEEQSALMEEFVMRYGPCTGFLPDGVENDSPEYQDILNRMLVSGFSPSTYGWVPDEEAFWRKAEE